MKLKKMIFPITGFLGLFALTYAVQRAAYNEFCPDWCILPSNYMHPWLPWASISGVAEWTLVTLSLQTLAVVGLLFFLPARWADSRFDGGGLLATCIMSSLVLYGIFFALWMLGQSGADYDWHTVLFWFSKEEGQYALEMSMMAAITIGFTEVIVILIAYFQVALKRS